MTTFSQINRRLDLFTTEPGLPQPRFDIDLRVAGWNWAQQQLLTHTPRQMSIELVVDSGNRSAVLPSDFYAADGVYDSQRSIWWRPMRRHPGDIRFLDDDVTEFWTWGGEMRFEDSVEYGGGRLMLYYWAYYPDIAIQEIAEVDEIKVASSYSQEQVYTPKQYEVALMHLTAAFCWTPFALSASDVNEYKIRIDSGTPIMNPRALQAREHLFWWDSIMDRFPPAMGSVTE